MRCDSTDGRGEMTDILRLSGVQVRIAGSHILQGIDFAVAAGGVTAVLGRNGVGKTTTLKAILGLVPATGSIEFDGARIDGVPTHRIVRGGVGLGGGAPKHRANVDHSRSEVNARSGNPVVTDQCLDSPLITCP